MGKIADPALRLQCVHCHNTETPLWRAGPDGPKTLCNACGVRYKKGKLLLYKDDNGNLTAVQRHDAVPFHVPPSSKKASRKVPSPASQPASPDLSAKRSAIRKVPSEGAIVPQYGKKPRSRSRRANAGQLPGRYATKTLPDNPSSHNLRSPATSPRNPPSTLSNKTPSDENRVPPLNFQRLYTVNEPPLSKFIDPEDESMFPDMASLGLDCSPLANNTVVLPMPVDASCVEQFSFAFTGCGNSFRIDAPDRREALRGLLLDRTRKLSRTYEATVGALARLCEQRYYSAKAKNLDGKLSSIEDCRNFVRAFAHEQSCSFGLEGDGLSSVDEVTQMMCRSNSVAMMLPEKTAHCNAVNCFKALMDSSELDGFAEACMVELLGEDVITVLTQQGHTEFGKDAGCRTAEAVIRPKAIPTPA